MAPTTKETIDDYYRALGMLAVAHSEMEHWMKSFANLLINPWTKAGEIMTYDLPSKPLRDKLMSLYRNDETDQGRTKNFELLLDRIRRHTDDRNKLFHSFWFFYRFVDGDLAVRFKGKSSIDGLESKPQPVSISEVLDLVNRIQQSSSELQRVTLRWQTDHDSPKITLAGEEDEVA